MELVDDKKLEEVANFIGEMEVEGNCVCDDLQNVLADTKYDLETAKCDNRELADKLEQIRGILDEHY